MATLYVVATPIGNLEDITVRALRVLGEVEALACEDTRLTRRIFERHQVHSPKTIFSYHEHNEALRAEELLGKLHAGTTVALVSDAGTPLVSDPGYKLVREAREAGCRTVAGIDHFVRQAVEQFELWTGRPAPVETMRRVVVEALK